MILIRGLLKILCIWSQNIHCSERLNMPVIGNSQQTKGRGEHHALHQSLPFSVNRLSSSGRTFVNNTIDCEVTNNICRKISFVYNTKKPHYDESLSSSLKSITTTSSIFSPTPPFFLCINICFFLLLES